MRTFVEEYRRELARLTAADRASERSKRRELARVEKGIRRIIEAVKEAFAVPSMRDELHQLEARKAALKAEIEAATESDDVPVLHPGQAKVYRRKVAELTDVLSDEGRSAEAAEAIRALLQEIRLVPEGEALQSSWSASLPGSWRSTMRARRIGGPPRAGLLVRFWELRGQDSFTELRKSRSVPRSEIIEAKTELPPRPRIDVHSLHRLGN